MLCICFIPLPSWYPLHAFQSPNSHTWLPITSSFLCCYPSNFTPLFFKWLFLCRFPSLILPGPPSAHSHLFKWNPSIPPHNFLTGNSWNSPQSDLHGQIYHFANRKYMLPLYIKPPASTICSILSSEAELRLHASKLTSAAGTQ